MKVNINGVDREVDADRITYFALVELAGETGYPSVTYSGPRRGYSRRSGEMHAGCEPVKLEDGMVFSVIHTGNA